jgi:hypothetical protein
MMVGSIAAVVYSMGNNVEILGISIPNLWVAFKTVVLGIVPALIFVVGLFIVWLELDELRVEGELKEERKKKR